MTLTAHHYFPLGSENVGDALVALAIRKAVVRHFGEVTFVDMPVNDRYRAGDRLIGLVGDNVDRANAEADLVIIGGSNLLEPRKRGRWGVVTDVASINRLRPPLLLMGMGTGSDMAHRVRRYAEPGISEIRALHEKAFAAAVRDQRTTDELGRIGVRASCTGCPVTFLTNRPIKAQAQDGPLLVSFPPPRIEKQWSGKRFMRQAMNYVAWLKERGVPVVVTLHDSRDVQPAKERVPEGVEVFFTESQDELIARFEQCRGVVGFRLHAALLGFGLGKPIIPVGVDWRGLGFQTTFGLEDYSIRSLRTGQFKQLRNLTEQLLAGDEAMIERQAAAKQQFQGRFEAFLADAAHTFSSMDRSGVTAEPGGASTSL